MRFNLELLCFILFLYLVSSNSEYYPFPNAYCFPVNRSLTCTSLQNCRDLCSDLSLSCCGFYYSINRDGFDMCSCSESLRIYGNSASQSSSYPLHLPLDSLNTISCENIKDTSAVCDYHSSCEYSDDTCVPKSDSEKFSSSGPAKQKKFQRGVYFGGCFFKHMRGLHDRGRVFSLQS